MVRWESEIIYKTFCLLDNVSMQRDFLAFYLALCGIDSLKCGSIKKHSGKT